MANYITSFSSTTAYDEAMNLDFPNVSLIESDGSLKYAKTPDYSKCYFTIVSEADDNVISIVGTTGAPVISVSASTDDGATWSEYSTGNTITLNAGDKLLLKGVNNGWSGTNKANAINSNDSYYVEGNIMSLMHGDNFLGQTSLSNKHFVFYGLFINNSHLTNAENLILPATTLAQSCYENMFRGCTSLTTAPTLPATTLGISCYQGMFRDCTSLTTAPALPATTSAQNCCKEMFKGCSRLNYIKCLATDISAPNCTTDWVKNVSSTGTFVKDASMSSWTTGVSGIPDGWTVQDASA